MKNIYARRAVVESVESVYLPLLAFKPDESIGLFWYTYLNASLAKGRPDSNPTEQRVSTKTKFNEIASICTALDNVMHMASAAAAHPVIGQ